MPQKLELTLVEIKDIIQGLRMSGLTSVEDAAMDEIRMMIKALPSSEGLERDYSSRDMLKKLQAHIGGIMRLIEIYSQRDPEYKARYKSRTGLPPRYKILEWSRAMQKKQVKAMISELSQSLVKNGFEKESEIVKSAGISEMWGAGKEAYYYRTIIKKIFNILEKQGKEIDNLDQKVIPSIKNPEFKAKLEKVADRLHMIQTLMANLKNFMDDKEVLSDDASAKQVAKEGGKVTFKDGQQYTVQKVPDPVPKKWIANVAKTGDLWINVQGVPYKVEVAGNGEVKDFVTLSKQQQSRDTASNVWSDYGIDWAKDIDPVVRSMQNLDLANLPVSSLDNLYNLIEKATTTAPTVAKSDDHIVMSYNSSEMFRAAAVDPKMVWDKAKADVLKVNPAFTAFPDYQVVLKVLKNIWSGNLKDPNLLVNLKNVIDAVKETSRVRNVVATPAQPAPTNTPAQPPFDINTMSDADKAELLKLLITASSKSFYKSAALTPQQIQYVQELKKSNPAEVQRLIQQLQTKQTTPNATPPDATQPNTQGHIVNFKDIARYSDANISVILSNINIEDLPVALSGESNDIVEKFLNAVSRRAAQIIREEMANTKPTPSEIQGKQKIIIDVVNGLIDKAKAKNTPAPTGNQPPAQNPQPTQTPPVANVPPTTVQNQIRQKAPGAQPTQPPATASNKFNLKRYSKNTL